MKIKVNKQAIISLETVCGFPFKVYFQTKIGQAAIVEEIHRLRAQAKAKMNCQRQATLDISYTQCQCLILICDSLEDFTGHPEIVKEYVINPILKSLLEPGSPI